MQPRFTKHEGGVDQLAHRYKSFGFQRWEIGIFGQQVMCYEFFQHVRHTSDQKWTFIDWLPEARSVCLIGDFHEFPDTPIVVALGQC